MSGREWSSAARWRRCAVLAFTGTVGVTSVLLAGSAAQAADPSCGSPVVSGHTATVTCSYTGANQSFTYPPGVSRATFTVYGAEGGTAGSSSPGLGGEASAIIAEQSGTTLTIVVGGQGASAGAGGAGGFGGGGTGGGAGGPGAGAGGGGGSFVQTSLGTNLLIAGGGGGAEACQNIDTGATSNGGQGGGVIGSAGTSCNGGSPGFGGSGTCSGGIGVGGSDTTGSGGGGGGGCVGGSAGANLAGGGGGSGFAPRHATLLSGANSNGDGEVIITYHAK